MRGLLRRLRPQSYRTRVAIALVVALAVVTVGIQGAIRGLVNAQVRDDAQHTLQQQAQAIADQVARATVVDRGGVAADAAQILPGTRLLVLDADHGVLYFDIGKQLSAEATARSGPITVKLQRRPPQTAAWIVPTLVFAGLLLTAALVWLLSSQLARRLRRQTADLASSAEAVAAGDLSARAAITDDELGRAAQAFNRMAEQLAEAELRQRRFLADIAHELRTPVTVIDGFAAALDDGIADTPAERAEAAAFIRQEAARLRDLIADLRELTWLDLGPETASEPIDLTALARASLTRLGPAAAAAGVSLSAPTEPCEALGDPEHVETILANLLANALRHTPSGGRVDVSAGLEGGRAWLRVADTGAGIAPEHLPHVFDRLYRADPSRRRDDGGGSGLGLAIVDRLAELMGGSMEVESVVGRGAAFTLRLPAPAPTPGAPADAVAVGDQA
jgi:two-component system sensor histidine kinase BaeS